MRMLPSVDPVGAWTTVVASAAIMLAGAFPLRTRLPAGAVDAVLGLGGAGAALGGLLFLDDVGIASWIAAPLIAAGLTIAHVRALFGGSGPLRT